MCVSSSSSVSPLTMPAAHADDADIGEVGEELQSAVAMLRTDPAGGPAVELLAKVLRNIVASPAEPKFRCKLPHHAGTASALTIDSSTDGHAIFMRSCDAAMITSLCCAVNDLPYVSLLGSVCCEW